MKIVRFDCADGAACRTDGWLRGWIVGLCLWFEDDMGVALGVLENDLVVVVVATPWQLLAVDVEGVCRRRAFVRLRIAGLLDILCLLNTDCRCFVLWLRYDGETNSSCTC